MPITVTTTTDRNVLEVGVTEERTQVLLDVVLVPGELTGVHNLEVRPFELEERDVAFAGAAIEDTRSELERERDQARGDAERYRRALDATEKRAEHYYDEADRLAKRLANLRDERAVTRWLDADEARELAAVLWHYAGETERR